MKLDDHTIDLDQLCSKYNLNPQTIKLHQQRIKEALLNNKKPYFKILDTCRIDNYGILKQEYFEHIQQSHYVNNTGFVSFVPAAGASSRYFVSASELLVAITHENIEQIKTACKNLLAKGVLNWIIPQNLKNFILNYQNITSQDIPKIKSILQQPKALFPCTVDNLTFLEMKLYENAALDKLDAQIFIAPYNKENDFHNVIYHFYTHHQKQLSTKIIEQGPELSTIRFDEEANPILEKDASLSIVPAGHGALINIIEKIKTLYPSSHSILIRNIDNVVGITENVIKETKNFLNIHVYLLNAINQIRQLLDSNQYEKANKKAQEYFEKLCAIIVTFNESTSKFLEDKKDSNTYWLWSVLCKIFHFDYNLISLIFNEKETDEKYILKTLYKRPLNTLGQVPNIHKDIGGTPCFVEIRPNMFIKLCLEVPHATNEDKQHFLANPTKATHFNPVFVASELGFPSTAYADTNNMFWILSEKPYLGKKSYYHETVLYEILGNSLMANVVFIEISRKLFNPHKTVESLRPLSAKDWGIVDL